MWMVQQGSPLPQRRGVTSTHVAKLEILGSKTRPKLWSSSGPSLCEACQSWEPAPHKAACTYPVCKEHAWEPPLEALGLTSATRCYIPNVETFLTSNRATPDAKVRRLHIWYICGSNNSEALILKPRRSQTRTEG